jgi:hypothetical protein
MLDFLSDIKQALTTGRPDFSVRNEHNIDTIISAYNAIDSSVLEHSISFSLQLAILLLAFIVLLSLLIKCLTVKLRAHSSGLLDLYHRISPE